MTDFQKFFHAVNIHVAIKQQQYYNTVRPQLNSDRFTQHMTSQTWRLKKLFLNEYFAFNTEVKYFDMKETYFLMSISFKCYTATV